MTDDVVISAHGLSRRFGTLEAVHELDLEVRRGEVFGFLGPNGAGKSTLMRMLVGLLDPSAGAVSVLGLELPRQSEQLRERLGYMTQRFSLYEDLSIEENLEFAGEVFGLAGSNLSSRIEYMLEDHGLAEHRDQRAGELSGGWRQRLALAAATIHRPELLVLDEPTAGVDPQQRRMFWRRLFDLAGEGVTVLVSTHYMDEAIRCHRLCVLRGGERVAVGRPNVLTEALRGRVLRIEASEPEDALDVLLEHPFVASATQLGDMLHALLQRDIADVDAICRTLREAIETAGLGPASAALDEPDLEDVFVALTLGEQLVDEEVS